MVLGAKSVYKRALVRCNVATMAAVTVAVLLLSVLGGVVAFSLRAGPNHTTDFLDPDFDSVKYLHGLNFGKIIIDTDCGGDDAVAILLALLSDGHDVVGITTTVGNTDRNQVIINVLKTLRVLGSKIPVYPGAEEGILTTPESDYFYGRDGLGDVPDPDPPKLDQAEKEHAVMALVRLINKYPNELTIVALGPLTNIALAMKIDPTIRDKIKDIVWTGGSVAGVGNVRPGIEYNAYFDPASNFAVFNATKRPVIMVPWELFLNTNSSLKWRTEVLGALRTPSIRFLNAVEAHTFKGDEWVMADGKTMAVALEPTLVTKAVTLHVEAITEGEYTKGAFLVDYNRKTGRAPNAIIVQAMSSAGFKNRCLENFSRRNPPHSRV